MAGLAKSNGNTTTIFRVKNKNDFVKSFNASKPPKEFMDSCKKAGKLFDRQHIIKF